MVARTRRMADWRGVRGRGWRCSIRMSGPFSLKLDGVRRVVRDALRDADSLDLELEDGWVFRVLADLAGDDEGRLEREVLQRFEDFFGDGGLGDDALDSACAVAEGGKQQLAGAAEVVEPAADGDGFADVGADVGDGGEVFGGGELGGHGCPVYAVRRMSRRGRGPATTKENAKSATDAKDTPRIPWRKHCVGCALPHFRFCFTAAMARGLD